MLWPEPLRLSADCDLGFATGMWQRSRRAACAQDSGRRGGLARLPRRRRANAGCVNGPARRRILQWIGLERKEWKRISEHRRPARPPVPARRRRRNVEATDERMRSNNLSITHMLCAQLKADFDISEAGHSAPHDRVPGGWIRRTREVATETRETNQRSAVQGLPHYSWQASVNTPWKRNSTGSILGCDWNSGNR